jgi:hypothetical protein
MKPSSRTPEGEPNCCPICGNKLRLEPSDPPGDAPCPFCGCLLWFRAVAGSGSDDEIIEETPRWIRIRFHGGSKDGIMLAGRAKDLADRYGRRYYILATRGKVGMQWREVPISEQWLIQKALKPYGSPNHLSNEELRDVVQQLAGLKTHVYQVTHKEDTEDWIYVELHFVREDVGL